MKTARSQYIGMVVLSLLTFASLPWTSFNAPRIEIGFFWGAVVSALSVSLYAWCNGERISQTSMSLIYIMLSCSVTLAVTSLVDLANFSILGDKHDAETGMLIGGVISFCMMTVISIRLSLRFPASMAWGSFAVWVMASILGSQYGGKLEPESALIINASGILIGGLAFIALCYCKKNLTDSQYLSLLTTIAAFILVSVPSSEENLPASLITSFITFMAGLLFLLERKNMPPSVKTGGLMLLGIGLYSLIQDTLHKALSVNEIAAGIPGMLLCLMVIRWIRNRKSEIPRGLYWVSLFAFGLSAVTAVIPNSQSDFMLYGVISSMTLFVLCLIWFAPSSTPTPHYSWPFRCGYATAVMMVITVTCMWVIFSFRILANISTPARILGDKQWITIWLDSETLVSLTMRDESYWPEEVGSAAPDNPWLSSYLKEIRPAGDRFSAITYTSDYRNSEDGYTDETTGFYWSRITDGIVISRVSSRSSAGMADLNRGDRIMAINGKGVDRIKNSEDFEKHVGDWKNGTVVSMKVLSRDGRKRNVSVTVGKSKDDPPLSSIITTARGNRVGYLYLENFDTGHFRDINKHFAKLTSEGIKDLVLDLRYNSGGVMENAGKLADFIAGGMQEEKLFIRMEYSPRYEDRNSEYLFEKPPFSLETRRLVVLTTDKTCSASESIINGLKPYLPVYTVGSTTCGKPFSMHGITFDDKIIFPVNARIFNSRGEGYYESGIRPDFKAEDDFTRELGDPKEGMLKKALEVLER